MQSNSVIRLGYFIGCGKRWKMMVRAGRMARTLEKRIGSVFLKVAGFVWGEDFVCTGPYPAAVWIAL